MGKLKGYLLQYNSVTMHRRRYGLFIPSVGVLWPELGKVRKDIRYMEKIQNLINGIKRGEKHIFGEYKFLREKDVPESLVNDFIGWVESREISEEGIKESGSKLEKYFGAPSLIGD